MLPGKKQPQSHKQPSGLELFTLQYPSTPFSKEGAEILTSLLIDEVNPQSVSYCFVQKGQSYYMTPYFVNKAGTVGSPIAGLLKNLGGTVEIKIGDKIGHILADPKGMIELANRAQRGMEAFAKQTQKELGKPAKQPSCSIDQLARKLPENQLELPGIQLYRDLALTELGLSQGDVLYYTMQGSFANQRHQFNECIQVALRRNAGYIFCNDGKHTNLISYRQIDGAKCFFICDSQGYKLKKSCEKKLGSEIVTMFFIGQELINLQIDTITSLNYKVVIGTETRQNNLSSCPAFAREDLRVLHHYDHWHREILHRSVQTHDNPQLFIFPKFPAQMLLLWQVSLTKLLNDPRSKHSVADRDGERSTLSDLLLRKHYDKERGLNIYARTLIDEFLTCIGQPARRLAKPFGVCVPQVVPNPVTSSSLSLSLVENARADVSILPYNSLSLFGTTISNSDVCMSCV